MKGQETKLRLQEKMAYWKSKGNNRLAEACAIALENDQTDIKQKKTA